MQSASPSVGVSKKALWTGRVMSGLIVLLMAFSAVMKFAKPAAVIQGFAHFGIPENLIFGLGVLELACTLIYVIPRTSVFGAILLTGYLGGATLTSVRIGEAFFGPVLIGVFVWGGLFLRNPQVRALIPLRQCVAR
jgi:hypothetical protein